MRSIEIFLNFSTHYLNRAILRRKRPNAVSKDNIDRMNEFWGDSSWMDIAYRQQETLFGHQEEKITNRELALAYQNRLINIAGFEYVPEPTPMKNSKGAVVYYLFFASHKPVAKKIVENIFKKYRTRGFS